MMLKHGMIKVSTAFERIVHWYLALTCLLLAFTGLGMMFHAFNFIAAPFGGLKNLKLVHNVTGLFFIPGLLLAAVIWWREAGTLDLPADLEWLKKAGGYLWKVDKLPPTGKYNLGQKLFFLVVVLVGIMMIVSGLLMWHPENYGRGLINLMYALHALGVVLLLPFIVIHIYLGTVGVPGSAAIVFTGYTTREWCLSQCPKWLRRQETEGKLEVYGGK